MRRPLSRLRLHRQRGFVLVTALIFLVVLTLIGVVATKNTTLGLKMSRNFLEKTQTFEAAETARVKADDLLDAATYNRGWPTTYNGTVTPSDFNTGNGFYGNSWPCTNTGDNCTLTLLGADGNAATSSNTPWVISDGNQASETFSAGQLPGQTPSSALINNLKYEYDGNPAVYGYIAIYKLGVGNAPGSGAAMISGYEGTGKGAAGAGALVYYYLRSQATLGGFGATGAAAYTGADYRAVIR